jgi:hypothetical protein
MICWENSPISIKHWPLDYFAYFLPSSRLILSKSEQELLTKYVEATLSMFQRKIGGFAVPPKCRIFAFSMITHLLTESIIGGIGDLSHTEELMTQALAMVEASEAKYGPF